jgi:SAM-dependent methyltransferase
MIERARDNAKRDNFDNVEFRLGEIEHLPIADNSADIIISNCVINLSPDKEQVFKEAYRVLKPGGSFYISDIVLLKELPDFIKEDISLYSNCIAGAILKADYLNIIKNAGFQKVEVQGETIFPIEFLLNDPIAKAFIKEKNITDEQLKDLEDFGVSIKVRGLK